MKPRALIITFLIMASALPLASGVIGVSNGEQKPVNAKEVLKPFSPELDQAVRKNVQPKLSPVVESLGTTWNTSPGFWWNTDWEYRINVTLQEPGVTDRVDWPVDVYIKFPVPAHKYSIRVVDSNGDEIPSQVWNVTLINATHLKSATVTFVVNIPKGGNATFSIYWSTDYVDPPTYPKRITFYQEAGVYYISSSKGWSIVLPAANGGKASKLSYNGIAIQHQSSTLGTDIAHFGTTIGPTLSYEGYWGDFNTNNEQYVYRGIVELEDSLEQIYAGVVFVTYAIEEVPVASATAVAGKATYYYRFYDWGIMIYEKVYFTTDVTGTIYVGGWVFDQDDGPDATRFTVLYPPEILLPEYSWELILYDEFSTLDTNVWDLNSNYNGYPTIDTSTESVVLTPDHNNAYGQIWYSQEIKSNFIAEFSFWAGPNTGGADGLVFMFFKDKNYAPGTGGSLGFNGSDGWGVEIDTWNNPYDPTDDHIAIINNTVSSHLNYTSAADLGISLINEWHVIRVKVVDDKVWVWLDGNLILTAQDPNLLNRVYGWMGFSAATGGATNYHKVGYIKVWIEKPGAEGEDIYNQKAYADKESIGLVDQNNKMGVGAVFLNLDVNGTYSSAVISVYNEGNQTNDGYTTDLDDYIYWAVNVSGTFTGGNSISLLYALAFWNYTTNLIEAKAKFDELAAAITTPLDVTYKQLESFKVGLTVNVTLPTGEPIPGANVTLISAVANYTKLTNSSGLATLSVLRANYSLIVTLPNEINATYTITDWANLSVIGYTTLTAKIDVSATGIYKVVLTAYDKRGITGIEGGQLIVGDASKNYTGLTDATGTIEFYIASGTWTLYWYYKGEPHAFNLTEVNTGTDYTPSGPVWKLSISITQNLVLKLIDYNITQIYPAYLEPYYTSDVLRVTWGDMVTLKVYLYNETTALNGTINWRIIDEEGNVLAETNTSAVNGVAELTFNSSSLPAGKTYGVKAKAIEIEPYETLKYDYVKPEFQFSLTVDEVPTEIDVSVYPTTIYYGDSITVYVYYTFTKDGNIYPVYGASGTLVIFIGSQKLEIPLEERDDVYVASVGVLDAGTYSATVSISRANFTARSKDIVISVLPRPTEVSYPIPLRTIWNETYSFVVEYIDSKTGEYITGAEVSAVVKEISTGDTLVEGTVTPLEGTYKITINLTTLTEKDYLLELQVGKKDYENKTVEVTFTVLPRPSSLKVNTTSISARWGDIVAIEVKFYDEDANVFVKPDRAPTAQILDLDTGDTVLLPAQYIIETDEGFVVKFNTSILGRDVGKFTIQLSAYKQHYEPASASVLLFVSKRVGVPLLSPAGIHKAYWGDEIVLYLIVVDKDTGAGVTGIEFHIQPISGNVSSDAITIKPTEIPGTYEIRIDTGKLLVGNYTIRLLPEKEHYDINSVDVVFSVLPVQLDMYVETDTEVLKNPVTGSAETEVKVRLTDKATGAPLSNATVLVLVYDSEDNLYANITAEETDIPGLYVAVIDWKKAEPLETYNVTVVVKTFVRNGHIGTSAELAVASKTLLVRVDYFGRTVTLFGHKFPALLFFPSIILALALAGALGYKTYAWYKLPEEVREVIKLMKKIEKGVFEYIAPGRFDEFKEILFESLGIS